MFCIFDFQSKKNTQKNKKARNPTYQQGNNSLTFKHISLIYRHNKGRDATSI